MQIRLRPLAAAALCALVSSPLLAADGLRPLVGAAITGGGETLATVQYTDGSSQKVRSGGLLHLFGGFEYQTGSFTLQGNVGYHVDDTNAKNGSVKFSRMPVELLGFWQLGEQWRAGLGVRQAGSAKLSSSGAASSLGGLTLKGQTGAIVQGEYFFEGGRSSAYLRYVVEDYKVNGVSISGNHVGLGVAFRF